MDQELESIEKQLPARRDFDRPPLHLWNPPLSGDIEIQIVANGDWYHEGGKIERESLVRLFASILRRESDGDYYLVTPAEKWRISVDLHPLIVNDIEEVVGDGGAQVLRVTLNTGRQVDVTEDHPLFLEPAVDDVAAITLDHGLSALFSRAAWYRLVELAEDNEGKMAVRSSGVLFPLERVGP